MTLKKFFTLALMIIFTLGITVGCEKNTDAQYNLVGAWAKEEGTVPSLVFFEDGSVILGAYQQDVGTWEVINGNQLVISLSSEFNYIFPIESFDGNSMTLSENGQHVVFYRIPDPADSDESNLTSEKQLNQFVTDVSSSGQCWIEAIDGIDDFGNYIFIYTAIDEDGDELYSINANEYSICSSIYDGFSVVSVDSERMVFNDKGENVTSQYADLSNGEYIVGIFEDITGISIWTLQDIDTYDSHTTMLRAKSTTGEIKQTWESNKPIGIPSWQVMEDFHHVEKGIYRYGDFVININTGHGFVFPQAGNPYGIIGVDDNDCIYFTLNRGNYISLTKATDSGEELWNTAVRGDISYMREGFIFANNQDYIGFLDLQGSLAINLDFDVWNNPVFIDDCALVECMNDGGVYFVTLIDKNGTMLFEPIQGRAGCHVSVDSSSYVFRSAWKDYFIVTINDQLCVLNSDGTVATVPDYWCLNESICRQVDKNTFWVIENGCLNTYNFPA